jgi:hypothetical protein
VYNSKLLGINMQAESETHKIVPVKLQAIANTIRLTGWVAFWIQLGLVSVSSLALLSASTGRNLTNQPSSSLGVGIFWAVLGIVVLLFSLFWDFRYTHIGRKLANLNPHLHPSKADTVRTIRLGIMAGLVGILLTLLGSSATVAVLIAKSISQPPGVAITDPNKIIRTLDVLVLVANVNGIAAHYIGTVASIWLLERVNMH